MKITKSRIKEIIREEIQKLTELTKFTPAHIKQLQKAFKNAKGILPDSNPVMQKLKKMLIGVDRKNLELIAKSDINILSPIAKKRLGMKEGKLTENEVSSDKVKELSVIVKELENASKMHKTQSERIDKIVKSVSKTEGKLTEAPKDIHHSQAKFFWVHKSDIKKASKLLLKNFPPKGGYHRVEIAGKTGRVSGHFAITTDKRTYNDALELLAKNRIKVRG